MTFEETRQLMQITDRKVAEALKADNAKIPCCRGCFHCCKEPVYADLSEVRYILSHLSDGEREALKVKVRDWLEVFEASGLDADYMPSAFRYRALNLWCPFLLQGHCSIYATRPTACRMHVARESAAGCKDDALRKHQLFALFPELSNALMQAELGAIPIGETEMFDHFCMLLAQELFTPGEATHITASRLIFRRKTEIDLEIEIFNEKAAEGLPIAGRLADASNPLPAP